MDEVSAPLLEAFLRLVRLLDTPEDIPILAPLVQKEILYRLLMSEQGPKLRQIATSGSQGSQISRAIDWLRENYAQQLKIEHLARQIGMSYNFV